MFKILKKKNIAPSVLVNNDPELKHSTACVNKIFGVHGFEGWEAWKAHCRSRHSLPDTEKCFRGDL